MREAWSSPTRTAARPGVMPFSDNARTRSATSARICAAVAFPSKMRAVTRESYRRTAPAAGPRPGSSLARTATPGVRRDLTGLLDRDRPAPLPDPGAGSAVPDRLVRDERHADGRDGREGDDRPDLGRDRDQRQ